MLKIVQLLQSARILLYIFYSYIRGARYSFGVMPVTFLNNRVKCCGYWKPSSDAICEMERVEFIRRSFAVFINLS